MITVVDAGAGNLRSLTNALRILGLEAQVREAPPPEPTGPVVLPGVGAFGAAAAVLAERGWYPWLREQVKRGVPLVGICLGMQLLYEGSDESPGREGLGLIHGQVGRLNAEADKVPHIRWARLRYDGRAPSPRLRWGYFVHSFAAPAGAGGGIEAWARHGENWFPALVRTGSAVGVQFHPEKSGARGLVYLGSLLGGRP